MRLLSGVVVYEGPRPHSLAELRREVAASMGLECKDELVFCSGSVILLNIEDAGEEITAVRDRVMGFLDEFLLHVYGRVPEHLWPARAHRGFMLAAVERNGLALRHASAEVQADRDVVLAAVKNNGCAIVYAAAELRRDRDFVLAAVERNGRALLYAPAEFRYDQDFVRAARHIPPMDNRSRLAYQRSHDQPYR